MNQDKFEAFLSWVSAFDHRVLQNEDDVETKFVLPLFQHLGYPEKYRRGKYPLKTYSPGKSGRKPEIDQIYFSTDEPEKQSADTALVLVEAKEPQEVELENGVVQALFYSFHLAPLLVLVTNGNQIRILKRHRFKNEEVIFDGVIDELRDNRQSSDIFNQLNFETVRRLKETAINEITHRQYALLEQSLQRHPNLQDALQQGDFQESISRVGNRLTIVRPKVAITCDLPLAFGEGKCQIEFSNVQLHGLTVYLTHQNILGDLMLGLSADPLLGTRRFIRPTKTDTFEARLGQSTAILSRSEAYDLCACVDEMCAEYKRIITEAETVLETWGLERMRIEDINGFYLVSVKRRLWEFMKRFADEFRYEKGESEWHIFEHSNISIRITNRHSVDDHAFIWPKAETNPWSFLPTEYIDIIYEIPEWHLESTVRGDSISWQLAVGPKGTWTALQTKEWLLKRFIPEVSNYYATEIGANLLNNEVFVGPFVSDDYVAFHEITEPKQLGMYIRHISDWSMERGEKIPTNILRPYYQAFTELARKAGPLTIDISYCAHKMAATFIGAPFTDSDAIYWDRGRTFGDVLKGLEYHVARIHKSEAEHPSIVDDLSRIFLAIVEGANFNFSQPQLNLAKQAVLPLWTLARFEMRYAYPNRSV